jgi:hypothetical protein
MSENGRLLVSFEEMEDLLVRVLEHNTQLQERESKLWEKLEETHVLLSTALHELAFATKGEKVSVHEFISYWYRSKEVKL